MAGSLRGLGWGVVTGVLLAATLAASANDCPPDSTNPCVTIQNGARP